MKVVVDAMCVEYGGIRTYVDHLLGHWKNVFPEDELHVVLGRGSTIDTSGHIRHELTVRRPSVVGRPLAQTLTMHRLIRELSPDAVLATVPSTTVRRLRVPMAVVILDLRHELRPDQFSRSRRLLRKISYDRAYAMADAFLSISQRSLDDLHQLHPKTRTVPGEVTYLGADHVDSWPAAVTTGPSVAFAHHTNKNADLILDAWAVLAGRQQRVPPLTMLGVSGAQRDQLTSMIDKHALGRFVTLAPFLPDEEFLRTISAAESIVFPSDFEGFGLPIVEGMALGKPVVIGPERGTMEVANGHAVVMDDWTAEALADAVTSAGGLTPAELKSAQDWAKGFTWDRTVEQTREMLATLVLNRG